MSLKLRKDDHIFLIGSKETQILGSKLPFCKLQIASTSVYNSMQLNENVENETDSSENDEISNTKTSVAQEQTQLSPLKKKRRGKINCITQKLCGALDWCKLSVRDSVYVLQAILEALGFDNDDYIIQLLYIEHEKCNVVNVLE
jgi:hypothetical protein